MLGLIHDSSMVELSYKSISCRRSARVIELAEPRSALSPHMHLHISVLPGNGTPGRYGCLVHGASPIKPLPNSFLLSSYG